MNSNERRPTEDITVPLSQQLALQPSSSIGERSFANWINQPCNLSSTWTLQSDWAAIFLQLVRTVNSRPSPHMRKGRQRQTRMMLLNMIIQVSCISKFGRDSCCTVFILANWGIKVFRDTWTARLKAKISPHCCFCIKQAEGYSCLFVTTNSCMFSCNFIRLLCFKPFVTVKEKHLTALNCDIREYLQYIVKLWCRCSMLYSIDV